MSLSDPYSLGIVVAALGLSFWLVSRWLVRIAPGWQAQTQATPLKRPVPPPAAPSDRWDDPVDADDTGGAGEAVLTIDEGGRLISMNAGARRLFNVFEGETPGLERLVRRVRPGDALIQLCAQQGRAALTLNGRSLEGVSYRVRMETAAVMLVILRDPIPESDLISTGTKTVSPSIQAFSAFVSAITSSLDVETTVKAVLENVEKLAPADFEEIYLREPDGAPVMSYRMAGIPQEERLLEISGDRYQAGEGFTTRLELERTPILVKDVNDRKNLSVGGRLVHDDHIRSFLGFPLLANGTFMGTLELGSLTPDFFTQDDVERIQPLCDLAGTALQHALAFRAEQRRASELTGLTQLTQAFSSVRDSQSLFTRLVQSILPLVHVEILGFLLYDESQRMLAGQAPYHGVPSQFMELYRIPVPLNSPAEALMLRQQPILTADAIADPLWKELGWESLAKAANLHDTALIPLTSTGRIIGFLQASNHVKGPVNFSADEIHMLTIVANQAAPVIENAILVQQTHLRAQRADALRRLSSLAGSAATLDEIFVVSLQELAHLLHADMAAAFMLDPDHASLHFHAQSMFGDLDPLPETRQVLTAEDPQYPFTVSGSLRALNYNAMAEGQPIIPFYQAILTGWALESAVIVPLVVRDEGIGELWIGSHAPGFFDQGDLQVVVTAAGQLAGVVERSYLMMQTDDSLRQRVSQLTAMTRIGRELSISPDLKSLAQVVYEEALRISQVHDGAVVLFDPDSPADRVPRIHLAVGSREVDGLNEIDLRAIESQETVLVSDFTTLKTEFAHAEIESYLALPILYQRHPAGLIILDSNSPAFFTPEMVDVLQSLTTQTAAVLGYGLQFERELQRGTLRKQELETLIRLWQNACWRSNASVEESMNRIADAIRTTTSFRAISISLYEPASGQLQRCVSYGNPRQPVADAEQGHRKLHWSAIEKMLRLEFRVGGVYFIPAEQAPTGLEAFDSVSTFTPVDFNDPGRWNPDDLLMIPLYTGDGTPLGLIHLDDPANGLRPDHNQLEPLNLFRVQAELILDVYRKHQEFEVRQRELEHSENRLQQALNDSQQQLPMLLRTNLEQTMAIQILDRQVQHIRAGQEIAAQASSQKDASEVLRYLAREMLIRFGFEIALIAASNENGPRLVDVLGTVPDDARPEALFGQRNPLRQIIEDPHPLIVANVTAEPDWKNNPLLLALKANSFIALPLALGNGRTSGILICGQHVMQAFNEDDNQVFIQLANQVSVSIQNLDFLTETRRRLQEVNLLLAFNRQLTGLDPAQITQVLVDSLLRAIPHTRAGWAGLWNPQEQVLQTCAAAGYSDNTSMLAVNYPPDTLPARVLGDRRSRRVDEVRFADDYALSSQNLMLYRQSTGGKLPVSSLVVPISRGDQAMGVVVLDHFDLPAAFSSEDEDIANSLAQQAALAIENAHLFTDAQERAVQLQALTRVAGSLTSNLRSDVLIQSLLDQMKSVMDFDTATLWLREENRLIVVDATGFGDSESRKGNKVEISDSRLFQEMLHTQQPVVVADVRFDDRFPALLDVERLAWLGIPLVSKAELIGVLALEKKEVGFYTPERVQIGTTYAGQAAVALENARLFEESLNRAAELDQRSQRLALLNNLSEELASSLDVDTILKMTARQLQGALGGSRVAFVTVDEIGRSSIQLELPEPHRKGPVSLPKTALIDTLIESQGIFSSGNLESVTDLAPLYEVYFRPQSIHSLLMIPLVTGLDLYGWMWVQHTDPARFGTAEIELARTMCNQAAIAIQNARLFAETRSLTEDLERRVQERTLELRQEHRNTETLLSVITELSASLDLDQVLNRTLTIVNQSLNAEKSLVLLSGGARRYQAGIGLAEQSCEQEITKWVVGHREPVLVEDAVADERWAGKNEQPLPFRSIVAVPLIMGEEVLGALLLFQSQKSAFESKQISLIEAVARQISVALNNAELFNLIRDQAEHMGSLLREQQIAASRSRAILEAVADGVLVTGEDMKITLFNASAERILGLEANQALDRPLDQFSGLFGQAAQTWMETIRAWSESPSAHQNEVFAEQIEIDQSRVVSVHLAPVIWRSQLLGTVSIFRDITHEVQLDRLKTEFVANVSHELRTPLTSIKGYVDVILMGAAGPVSSQVLHFLQVVQINTERLTTLVNDLLDVSRIESGRISLEMQSLDLKGIAEAVLEDIQRRSRTENKAMQFTLTVPPEIPNVQGDPSRIRQVMNNIILNAYNYTQANGQVKVEMALDGDCVQVNVIDNGIGIVERDQKRIFERFFRGEDPLVLKTSGTGLGLALSKILVEMHHGRIWFYSSGQAGEGSTFSFTLPVVPPAA
jgi:PAS domain S-box-containing protein